MKFITVGDRIAKITTNNTDGDTNNPTTNTEKRNKNENHNPLFLASFELMKNSVTRLMILVLDNAYVHTKVNNKNRNVELPKLFAKTVLNPSESTKPNAKMHNKLGQSMPIVNHNIKHPRKINNTWKASVVNNPTGGINLPIKHNTIQIGIIVHLKALISLSFLLGDLS